MNAHHPVPSPTFLIVLVGGALFLLWGVLRWHAGRQPHRGHAGKVLIALAVGGMVLLWFSVASRTTGQRPWSWAAETTYELDDSAASTYATHEGSAWLDSVERVHRPDTYSSSVSAAVALCDQIANQVPQIGTPTAVLLELEQCTTQLDVPSIEQTIRDRLRKVWPDVDIRRPTLDEPRDISANPVPISSGETSVIIRLNCDGNLRRSNSSGVPYARGTIAATITHQQRTDEINVAYCEKPWVANFSQFLSDHPGQMWFAGRSRDLLVSSQTEARNQAVEVVADQIAQRIMVATSDKLGSAASLPQERLRADMVRAVDNGDFVVDEFAQELHTGEGKIWRHALLVRLKPDQLVTQTDRVLRQGQQAKVRRMAGAGSFAGLTILTLAMYFVLNAATKGYYRAFLLCISALVLLLTGGGLMMFVS